MAMILNVHARMSKKTFYSLKARSFRLFLTRLNLRGRLSTNYYMSRTYGYAAYKTDLRLLVIVKLTLPKHANAANRRQSTVVFLSNNSPFRRSKKHSPRRFTQKSCHVSKNSIHGNFLLLHYKLTLLPDNFADINAVSTFVMLSTSAMAIVSHALCMAS